MDSFDSVDLGWKQGLEIRKKDTQYLVAIEIVCMVS